MSLRAARDADSAAFVRIVADCWSEYPGCVTDIDGEAPELRRLASYCTGRGGLAWAADLDGEVIGLVCTWPLADGVWELAKMYVAAPHRGTGAARALVEAVEAFARAHGASRLLLWTDTRFERAHRFYEKLGFVRESVPRALHDKSQTIEVRYGKPLAQRSTNARNDAATAETSLKR